MTTGSKTGMPFAAASFSHLTRHRRFRDALALTAGFCQPYAFAPYDHWWLGLFSHALLLFLWVREPRRAWWYGWLFGVAAFGLGLSWLYVSIHEVGGLPAVPAGALVLLFGACLGLFPALAGWMLRPFARMCPAWILGMAVCVWVLTSWSRAWFLTGFPWLSPGAAYLDTPLAGFAPVLGGYGVELAALITAAVLVYVWIPTASAKRSTALGVVFLWLSGALLHGVAWTQPAGEPLQVSLVQGNIDQVGKWRKDIRQMTLDRYRRLTQAELGRDLIIWPETAVPAFLHQVRDGFIQALAEQAEKAGSVLLIGVPILDPERRYYNAVLAVGASAGEYRKRHLVPFGEYLPLAWLFRPLVDRIQIPMADFSPGAESQTPLQVKGTGVALGICYEDIFGAETARFVGDGGVLANVSNDAWFGDTAAPHQHHQMARMRALETGRPMIRVSNTGLTGFIDEKGRLGERLPLFRPGVLRGSVQPRGGSTPYLWWLDWVVVGMVLSGMVLGLRVRGA